MPDQLVMEATRALRPNADLTAAAGPATTFSEGGSTFGHAAFRQGQQTTERLANYELGPQIGAGGMGTVYRADHLWLGRTVAIKFIASHLLNHSEAASRFLHECRAVGALDHPNIVRATDAGQIEGAHYLVTEFVRGGDLASLVAKHGAFSIPDACEAIRQAALGLAHAHSMGLVHRDVKPSNLLLAESGIVKVLDFGLARMSAGQTTLTVTGQVIGTLDFLAPEQASDARLVNPAGDQYSLGCTLYYLLAGVAPFGGPAYDSPASKLKGHLADQPRPLCELRRKVPLALVACLERMMAKSPADRYENMAEVAEALEPFCRGAHLSALVGGTAGPKPICTGHVGLLARVGEFAERLVAVFGWAVRGAFVGQPAPLGGKPKTPVISLGGLAMFALLGFALSHLSCVALGPDGEEVEPGKAGFEFFEIGFGKPPPHHHSPPPRP